ncbi:FAD assembly factor SdhE [Chitinilyticum piscinae]|uniref:FAD assembly factor SdhE n=1 Tax=Chitinilyticum piscinae TaxID=2866724 RepID=A0A8J7FKJ0_9NEIS|nr:succinate dehydrogenase assembly factor 2 [Chitinilyticum piscinae]MBE9609360.1 succinate dehydrogenase assembly factor 2 [Chitinilyticum piscinae]
MDDIHLKRLVWRSRRGLLELDLQLERFVAEVLPTLSDADLAEYEAVLLLPDNDFLDYLNGKADCPDAQLKPMLERIRAAQH